MIKIGDVIKQLREEYNLSQTELAKRLNVGRSTIAMWENNERIPSEDKKEEIADFFNIDMNYLYGKTDIKNSYKEQISQSFVCSLEEQNHIQKYRTLDVHGKRQVDSVLANEIERIQEQKIEIAEESAPYMYAKTEYLTGLSAGTGLFVFDDIPTQVIEVPEIYKNADFVIGVTGDSMEPRYFNGEKVAVQKASTINIGDIGVFMHEGNGYIKEFGHNKLVSLNKAYPDIDVNETTICIGKVLGKIN